jgi:predicted transcriptional regulator
MANTQAMTDEKTDTLNNSLTLWISDEDRAYLDDQAKMRDRSRGWLVRELINDSRNQLELKLEE